MTVTREQVAIALLGVITKAYQWASPPSRRLKLWADVPTELRPAAFLVKHDEPRASQSQTLTKRSLSYKLFIYTNAKAADPTTSGETELNNILDAIDAALAPVGKDIFSGRTTLGGLVDHCQINGSAIVDPGDLDGDGVAIVPIKILLP